MTIIERKLLSKIQRRKGPRRIILQGIIDGIKVILKERIYRESYKYNISIYINIIIIVILWELLPITHQYKEININLELLIYLILSSFNFYTIIYSTLYSNNKYSIQALIRGINQLVSYEVNISIIIISIIVLIKDFNLYNYIQIDSKNIYLIPFFIILFISLLAESNRIPFDLLEGESELVAGRLTEYSSIEFTIIYLSEYLILLFNSSFLLFLFFFKTYISIEYLLFIIFIIISRAILPRLTYNKIITLNWYYILPLSFSFLFFYTIII